MLSKIKGLSPKIKIYTYGTVKINISYRFTQQLQLHSPSTNSLLHTHCSPEEKWVISKTRILHLSNFNLPHEKGKLSPNYIINLLDLLHYIRIISLKVKHKTDDIFILEKEKLMHSNRLILTHKLSSDTFIFRKCGFISSIPFTEKIT